MEIAAHIAIKLGMELVIEDMDFDSVVTSVGKNGVDVAMAGLTVNETRKQSVNFSESYYNAAQVLIVAKDNTAFDACKTADDVVAILNAKNADCKIGCQRGTTGAIYIDGDADEEGGYGAEGCWMLDDGAVLEVLGVLVVLGGR
jgi:polar amino acid transport system substrate-binding protein